MSVFEERGIRVDGVTTEVTELDVALFSISEARLEEIGLALKKRPLSLRDTSIGGGNVRHFHDYDVAYVVTVDDSRMLVTIANIQPKGIEPPLEDLLKKASLFAMLRGATGV